MHPRTIQTQLSSIQHSFLMQLQLPPSISTQAGPPRPPRTQLLCFREQSSCFAASVRLLTCTSRHVMHVAPEFLQLLCVGADVSTVSAAAQAYVAAACSARTSLANLFFRFTTSLTGRCCLAALSLSAGGVSSTRCCAAIESCCCCCIR
jgi:hypothetical protein